MYYFIIYWNLDIAFLNPEAMAENGVLMVYIGSGDCERVMCESLFGGSSTKQCGAVNLWLD